MDSRRSFLHFSYSAASLFVGSAITQAFSTNTTGEPRNGQTRQSPEPNITNAKAIFVPPEGNRSAEPTGNIKIRVSGNDNGGAVAVVEVQTNPDDGAPLHVHHVQNEWFYAFAGEYDIKVGDEIFHLTPGGSVYAPKLIPHTFHDVSEKGSKLLVVIQPAGHAEAFAVDLFKLIASGNREESAMRALFQKYDMEMLGPPLPKKRLP
jgi:mannose-6-phosphate isomerase-like protein (cupin superfamily)